MLASVSVISIGMLATLKGKLMQDGPSVCAPAPNPPRCAMTPMKVRPFDFRPCTYIALSGVEPEPATTISGAAFAKAPNTISGRLWVMIVRPQVAAGGRQFSNV